MSNNKDASKGFLTVEDMKELTVEDIKDLAKHLFAPTASPPSNFMLDHQTLEALKEWHKYNKQMRASRERKIKIMQHKGVILKQKSSKVLWEVVGTKTSILPGHLGSWNGDSEITRSIIKSKNSGRIKHVSPRLKEHTFDIESIPNAAKVLYGWNESNE